jgi:hypothetical protein
MIEPVSCWPLDIPETLAWSITPFGVTPRLSAAMACVAHISAIWNTSVTAFGRMFPVKIPRFHEDGRNFLAKSLLSMTCT